MQIAFLRMEAHEPVEVEDLERIPGRLISQP